MAGWAQGFLGNRKRSLGTQWVRAGCRAWSGKLGFGPPAVGLDGRGGPGARKEGGQESGGRAGQEGGPHLRRGIFKPLTEATENTEEDREHGR